MPIPVALFAIAAASAGQSPFQELPRTERQWQAVLTSRAEAGDVAGAVAARAELRKLRYRPNAPKTGRAADAEILPDPGTFNPGPGDVGKTYLFQLDDRPGARNGVASAYGTDVYTGGSGLLNCALHCGALRPGERGVVKVTVLPGQDRYEATLKNGVQSADWGHWHISFKVERAGPTPATP